MIYGPSYLNIEFWYNKATQEDIKNGESWYSNAYNIIKDLAKRYNRDERVVAGIIAALSPNNKWERNIIDTENMLAHGPNVSVSTYNINKEKAQRIISGEMPLDVLSGNKTRNFYLNILNNLGFVTIDRHAVRIALSDDSQILNPEDAFKWCRTNKRYQMCVKEYRRVAKAHNITCAQLQAITWCVYRRFLGY